MSTQAVESQKSGWLEFAAVVLFAIGFFRIISAITYFANSYKLNNLTNGLFSSHNWAWGLWDLLIAALAIMAGMSVLANQGFGRVFGYIAGVLVIVQGFAVINLAPWYGASAIVVGVLVVYGLAATPAGDRS
jgi:hypothetical protein